MVQKIILKYSNFIIAISIIYIIVIFAENFFKHTMLLIDVLLFGIPSLLLFSNGIHAYKNKKIDYLFILFQMLALLPIILHHTSKNRYLYIGILFLFMIVGQIFGYFTNYIRNTKL